MKLRIDKDRDIVRILITDLPIEESDEMANGTIYDYDKNGNLVGLEFLNASSVLGDLDTLKEHTHPRRKALVSGGEAVSAEYKPCLV